MLNDPIVNEVRKAGEQLACKTGYSIKKFFKHIRDGQIKWHGTVVDLSGENKNTHLRKQSLR